MADTNPSIKEAATKVMALADMPPGPEAKTAAAELTVLLLQVGQSLQKSGLLPDTWQRWVAAGIAILTLISGSAFVARMTAPSADPIAIEAKLDKLIEKTNTSSGCACGCVDGKSCSCKGMAVSKVTVYATTATDAGELAKLPAVVKVDSKVYDVGSTYPFGGKAVPLPCMALSVDGQVVDVAPFTNAASVAAFMAKKR